MDVDTTTSFSDVASDQVVKYFGTGLVKQCYGTSFGVRIVIFESVVADGHIAVKGADSTAGIISGIPKEDVSLDPWIRIIAADPAAATTASPPCGFVVLEKVSSYGGMRSGQQRHASPPLPVISDDGVIFNQRTGS